jgi:outer membrane lipoprotein-sorting protein
MNFHVSALKFQFVGIALLLFFALCGFNSAFASVDDEVLRIQRAYENIKDMKAGFVQKNFIKDLKRSDSYSGTIFIKPSKMRWDYKGEKPQTVYIVNEELIIYQIKEKQAFKTKFDRSAYGQTPLALLSGLGNMKNEFDVTVKSPGRLMLKPKKTMGNIAYLELSLSDGEFPIGGIAITDALSNRIEITIKDVEINTGIKDKIFEFIPPAGVKIFQQ